MKKQKDEESNIELADLIRYQEKTRREFDFSKNEKDMTEEEVAKKVVFDTLEKAIEDSIGKDKKDEIYKLMDDKFDSEKLQEDYLKIINLGQQIQSSTILQSLYLISHFDRSEDNTFYITINSIVENIILNKNTNKHDRVSAAGKLLDLIDKYESKVTSDFIKHEEIIKSLLDSLSKKNKELNFEKYSNKEGLSSFKTMKKDLGDWIEITRKLLLGRKKGFEALKADLNKERFLPEMVRQNNGDIEARGSAAELEMYGETMLELTKEFDEIEQELSDKQYGMAESLFGSPSEYMDILKDKEGSGCEDVIEGGSKGRWVIVGILSVIALSGGIWTAIGVFVLGFIILSIINSK